MRRLAMVGLLAVVTLAACSREPSSKSAGENAPNGKARPAAHPLHPIPPQTFAPEAFAALRESFLRYDDLRARLAADRLDLADGSRSLGTALAQAEESLPSTPEATVAREALGQARTSADELRRASTLDEARQAFAKLSAALVALAEADPRLTEGFAIFACPMTDSFPKWFQRGAEMANPYMGPSMLACGSRTEWTLATERPRANVPASEIAYYTCPMHPSVQSGAAGACPLCGMDLVPVRTAELERGTVLVDEGTRRRIKLTTVEASRRELTLAIRSVGEVRYDERSFADVDLRVGGWVQDLAVAETGQYVKKGQKLFSLFSPELFAAQLEHLHALATDQSSSGPGPLVRAGRQKLRILGMNDAQIRALETRKVASEQLPIAAPRSGYVVERNVALGTQVMPGQPAFRIAGLETIWVDARVLEADLPRVRVGQEVEIANAGGGSEPRVGRIDAVYPTFDASTRTGRIRVVLDNEGLPLRPGMIVDVAIRVGLGEVLAVPVSAVLFTGARRLVFVDAGEDRLEPREVEIGARSEGYYEIRSGLAEGERVVASGTFLVAAESRLRSAFGVWDGDR